MMYEMCDCGHFGGTWCSDHKAQIAYGHGPCTKCNCKQFTWIYFCDKNGNKLTDEQVKEMAPSSFKETGSNWRLV